MTAACAGDSPSGRVSLMTFNVENMFDAADDPASLDNSYLPLSRKQNPAHKNFCRGMDSAFRRQECLTLDWSQGLSDLKLARVGRSILQGPGARGPDIVVLAEVENAEILERLRTGPLNGRGYRPGILIEGNDARGIDNAILSRLPAAGAPRLHRVPYKGMTPGQLRGARGILEASFRLPGNEILTLFAVHFPAPVHPRKFREQALLFLGTLLDGLPPDRLAAAAGDFNISAEEDAEFRLFDRLVAGRWIAAHVIGCQQCPGTNYYAAKDSWSFLDTILLSKNLAPEGGGRWGIDPGSVRLANRLPEQNTRHRTPARFEGGSGVSDHWPLVLELLRRR